MPCRSLMPASETGPPVWDIARSRIAVTANRPLVVSRMVASSFACAAQKTRETQSSLQKPDRFSQPFSNVGVAGGVSTPQATVISLILRGFRLEGRRPDPLPGGEFYRWRSLNRWIFPVAVLGNSETN